MTALRLDIPAKINLHLEVLGARPDGYHEVRTLLQSIDLRDRVIVRPAPAGRLELEVEPAGIVAADDDNLVMRAARRLWDLIDARPGAHIRLVKRIPVAAGLGGGSADAAATLVLLDRMWSLDLDPGSLVEVASALGSDVPFFLVGGLCLGVGRGDDVTSLPDLVTRDVVVVVPPVRVSTREVYGRLESRLTWNRPEATLTAVATGLEREPPWSRLRNDLESVVCAGWPEVAAARELLTRVETLRAGVTGSGAATFALLAETAAAVGVVDAARARGWRAEITRTLSRDEAAPRPVECDEEDGT